MSAAVRGALLGLCLAAGLALLLAAARARRRPPLVIRLEPYLRDVTVPDRIFGSPGLVGGSVLRDLFGPPLARAGVLLQRVLGGDTSVAARLVRAGHAPVVERFRVEQVLWGAAGLAAGLVAGLVATGAGARPPVVLALVGAAAVAGVLARDQVLSAAVSRRERRLVAEFPAVADMLALSLGAGEGAVSALERIVRITRGELSGELGRALADARTGATLTVALGGIAERTGVPPLQRFVDGITVAVERGTPLAEVLRSQAADVREADRRRLIEAGGRKDILMMVPVVFLVLPVTILFALFPGFVTLQTIAS